MSAFDFTGDYPVDIGNITDIETNDEFVWGEDQSLNDRIEYWMSVRGFSREEAEQRVLTDLLDDAA